MNTIVQSAIAESLPAFLAKKNYTSIAVLVDNNTKKHCYSLIKDLLPKHKLIQIAPGEKAKTLATCGHIWEVLTQQETDRHGLLINLGGGVIGDMGGFCAATYKRGIDFVQIPTTLLSQVDASVGGKLGIDFNAFKNHIGVFQVPNAVLIDPAFLNTLPEAELRSGFAEVIKHCLIRDKSMWEVISTKDLHEQNWPALIAHSVAIKDVITTEDPTEKGLRKILNFGHTLGHAIETLFLGTKKHLLHGEAIAVGMLCESFIAMQLGQITKAELAEIEAFLIAIYGMVPLEASEFDTIINLTSQDKKNKGKEVRFSLLEGIGKATFDQAISKNQMRKALEYYAN
jgi:3-dehydroquinate synthase